MRQIRCTGLALAIVASAATLRAETVGTSITWENET
jgi:hypothetical protein